MMIFTIMHVPISKVEAIKIFKFQAHFFENVFNKLANLSFDKENAQLQK